MYISIILVALVLIGFIPAVQSVDWEYHSGELYRMHFYWKNMPIELTVIDDWKLMPGPCRVKNIAGCATYNTTDDNANKIILMIQHLNYIDQWGQSTLYHEIRHIECKCDFHENVMLIP